MSDKYAVVCNFREATSGFSEGALAYVHAGTAIGDSILVVAKSRSGRWVMMWQRRHKMHNFRVKTIPGAAMKSGCFKHDVYLSDSLIHAQIFAGTWIALNSDVDGRTVRV